MNFVDIAKEFADLNIFNSYTRARIIGIAEIFSVRSGTVSASQITLQSLSEFKFKTLQVAKPVTYNGYLKYLRIIGDYALSQHFIDKNLFRGVKLAPLGLPPKKTMTVHEIKQIHQYIVNHKNLYNPDWFWLTLIYCFYYTGMRRRQLVNLKRSDIDFINQTILLSYEGSKTRREWKIPIHEDLVPMLTRLISENELVLRRGMAKDDKIFNIARFNCKFKAEKDGGLKAESITGFFKRLTSKTKVPIGAHRFRHTLATVLCNPPDNSSPDIFAAQAILGHTSLQTTRDYVQTSVGRMDSALKKIGAPFGVNRRACLTSGAVMLESM